VAVVVRVGRRDRRDCRYADMTSSLDYLFQIAVEMKKLAIPWESDIQPTLPRNSLKGE
jgi:hypothetical protein